ncbi:MAG: hypothetical protein J7L19_04390 [Dehalococcoidia bacterium]|nr:hypothetical protein [Dehalococcoidia bacterium]
MIPRVITQFKPLPYCSGMIYPHLRETGVKAGPVSPPRGLPVGKHSSLQLARTYPIIHVTRQGGGK